MVGKYDVEHGNQRLRVDQSNLKVHMHVQRPPTCRTRINRRALIGQQKNSKVKIRNIVVGDSNSQDWLSRIL